jgi:hypothetical protein
MTDSSSFGWMRLAAWPSSELHMGIRGLPRIHFPQIAGEG